MLGCHQGPGAVPGTEGIPEDMGGARRDGPRGQQATGHGGKAGPRQEGKTKGKMDLSMKGAHSEYSSAEMRETYSLDEKSRF